ncbi:MAG: TIGR02266 family protein [Myxococcota bacterium]
MAEHEKHEERRSYVRLPLSDMMVRYGHDGRVFFGSCQNLSPGGLFIATKTPAPYGSEVTLKFTLPGHDSTLQAKGRVVRVSRETRNRALPNAPGMHVRFTKMTSITKEELKRFLVPRLRQMVIRRLAERQRTKKTN